MLDMRKVMRDKDRHHDEQVEAQNMSFITVFVCDRTQALD